MKMMTKELKARPSLQIKKKNNRKASGRDIIETMNSDKVLTRLKSLKHHLEMLTL